jgi:hypothetical protein
MFWIKQYTLAILIGVVLILASALSVILVAASVNLSDPVEEFTPEALEVKTISVNIKPQNNKQVRSIKLNHSDKDNKFSNSLAR